MPNNYDLLKDFVSPAGIAFLSLLVSYFIAQYRSYRKEKNVTKNKKLTFIDFLDFQMNNLKNSFDGLLIDLDERRFYSYKNINRASAVLPTLQKMSDEVVIFSDETLRRQIITVIDIISILISDIRGIEDHFDIEQRKNTQIRETVEKDIQTLKVELLRFNIEIFGDDIVVPIGESETNKLKIEAVNRLVKSTYERIKKANEDIEVTRNFCKDKRTIFSTRIVDIQAKIRELTTNLATIKENIKS